MGSMRAAAWSEKKIRGTATALAAVSRFYGNHPWFIRRVEAFPLE
jgi:hypothetical protein